MSARARAIPSYEDLLEEIHWLRHQLGLDVAGERVARVANAWGLQPAQAHLLLLLHARRGRMATHAFLEDNVPSSAGRDGDRQLKILNVWVHHIRRKVGGDAIQTHWGVGYSATPTIIARIDALLEDLT